MAFLRILFAASLLCYSGLSILRVHMERRAVLTPQISKFELLASRRSQEFKMKNLANMAYVGNISVGTPGQVFVMVFDTGSADLWVPADIHSTRSFYQHANSSTYRPIDERFEISYGSGSVYGLYCSDTIKLGSISLPDVVFAEVVDTSRIWNYDQMGFDGIVGLGFQSLSDYNASVFMKVLMDSGEIEEPVFAFHMTKDGPGELVLGGVDPSHYVGGFHYIDVSMPKYWELRLEAITFQGSSHETITMNTTNQTVIMDSGTSLLLGPMMEVQAIFDYFDAKYYRGWWTMACNHTMPSFSFVIGGVEWPFTAQDLIIIEQADACYLAVDIMDDGEDDHPKWILGDVFLRKYYVKFDYGQERVGIAHASHNVSLPIV